VVKQRDSPTETDAYLQAWGALGNLGWQVVVALVALLLNLLRLFWQLVYRRSGKEVKHDRGQSLSTRVPSAGRTSPPTGTNREPSQPR